MAADLSYPVVCMHLLANLDVYAYSSIFRTDENGAGCTEPIIMPVGVSGSFVVEPFIECDTVDIQHVPISQLDQHASYATAAIIAHRILPDVHSSTDVHHAGVVQLAPPQYLLTALEQCNQLNVPKGSRLEDYTVDAKDSRLNTAGGGGEVVAFPLVHNVASAATVAQLSMEQRSGLVEVTIGVYGPIGLMVAMTPAMALKHGGVLSLGEKFATGGGVCLTPPPPDIIPTASLQVWQLQ